jgi:hypothetical protein
MKKNVAFLLRGGVSKISGNVPNNFLTFTSKDQYVNIKCVKKSIEKHIIQTNTDYNFDFFIHCWCEDLKDELLDMYKPLDFLFENNENYKEEFIRKIGSEKNIENINYLSQISQAFSIKKVCEILENYIRKNNKKYDKIIIYRPDLLLWKDMNLENYDNENIYVNSHINNEGDFHWVLKYDNIQFFKTIYDMISETSLPTVHHHIKRHITTYFKGNYLSDDIIPSQHQEIVRKLCNTEFMRNFNIEEYDITREEVSKYIQYIKIF